MDGEKYSSKNRYSFIFYSVVSIIQTSKIKSKTYGGMSNMKTIQQLVVDKLNKVEFYAAKAQESLDKAPVGSLSISYSKGKAQFYHRTESGQHKGKYIEKENIELTRALAQKQYDQSFLRIAETNKKKLTRVLKLLQEKELIMVYETLSEIRKKLVTPHILPADKYIEQWLSVKYSGKGFDGNTPMLLTERGERVRSKTEKIIADKLFAMGIPYRYEYPVRLKGFGVVYPDFTLLNIEKREAIYMEHFGMMDNPEYCHKAIKKLEDYGKNGIYQGKNLLVTFETSQNPLNMKVVENMLQEFVLKG